MEVYVIRHTTPLIEKGICYGQSDIPLAPSFVDEWNKLKENLPSAIDCIYTSPLLRCRQLAQKLEQHYQVPLFSDIRLMEMHFGDWEMQAWHTIEKQALERWMNDYVLEKCPSGESYTDLLARVNDFALTIKKLSYAKIIVVTHAGVIKSFYSHIGGLTPQEAMSQQISYGQVLRFIL